jgi:hypothetical protein
MMRAVQGQGGGVTRRGKPLGVRRENCPHLAWSGSA